MDEHDGAWIHHQVCSTIYSEALREEKKNIVQMEISKNLMEKVLFWVNNLSTQSKAIMTSF